MIIKLTDKVVIHGLEDYSPSTITWLELVKGSAPSGSNADVTVTIKGITKSLLDWWKYFNHYGPQRIYTFKMIDALIRSGDFILKDPFHGTYSEKTYYRIKNNFKGYLVISHLFKVNSKTNSIHIQGAEGSGNFGDSHLTKEEFKTLFKSLNLQTNL